MLSFSFYYRESLDLRALFPKALDFSLLFPNDNIVIVNGVMKLLQPERLSPSRIRNIVRVYNHKYNYFKIEVYICCWKKGDYILKEVTPLGKIRKSNFFFFLRRATNRCFNWPYRVHLLTQNNISYYSYFNHLVKNKNGRNIVIGKMPRLLDQIYYEFLCIGDEAVFRTANQIYISCNKMTSWHLIYEGKRAIKNSMLWIEEENALIFIEYTPGTKNSRHHVYKYFLQSGNTKTIMTFYTPDEYRKEGKMPFCRHIHVLMRDTYTGDIFMGVGDSDEECAIYRSVDNGNSFNVLGHGSQVWRTLSFLFTKNYIMWNTDSPDPQSLNCVKRSKLNGTFLKTDLVDYYPLYNSACWNAIYDSEGDLYLMSSNCEGQLFDSFYRVYGIKVEDGKPIVYDLFQEYSQCNTIDDNYNQLFILGKDNLGRIWFYDTKRRYYRQFKLQRISEN